MRVSVHFLDGEVIDGSSEAMTFSKMGFPLVPDEGNNELAYVSLSSIKYVVIYAGNIESGSDGDPREGRGLPKVVIRFHDGEVIRTFRDENWGQDGEGFGLRIWDPKLRCLVRAVVSMHAVKGIFFVKEWDSRSAQERLQFADRRRIGRGDGRAIPLPPVLALNGNGGPHDNVVPLAETYRRRLAEVRDRRLATGSPAEFAAAVRDHLPRLVTEDRLALSSEQAQELGDAILRSAFGYGPLDPL